MPEACFADTFFFLALLNAADETYHARARAANRVDRPIITSAWVLLELADHLCDVQNRHLFGRVLDALDADTRFEVVPADQAMLDAATALYRDREDKERSLTDCTSLVLIQRRGMREVLTADHHFEQAGYTALLK